MLHLNDLVVGIVVLEERAPAEKHLTADQKQKLAALESKIQAELMSPNIQASALDNEVREMLTDTQKEFILTNFLQSRRQAPPRHDLYMGKFHTLLSR